MGLYNNSSVSYGSNSAGKIGLCSEAGAKHAGTFGLRSDAEAKHAGTFGLRSVAEAKHAGTFGLRSVAEAKHAGTFGLRSAAESNLADSFGLIRQIVIYLVLLKAAMRTTGCVKRLAPAHDKVARKPHEQAQV